MIYHGLENILTLGDLWQIGSDKKRALYQISLFSRKGIILTIPHDRSAFRQD